MELIGNKSHRVLHQLDKFEKYKSSILDVISNLEKEYDITVFYASETGSRGIGNDMEDSDFDITGFFVPKSELEYFKIIRKFDKTVKFTQDKIKVCGREFEIDIELWDLKEWLRSKV